MTIIREGYEWQARELADAADAARGVASNRELPGTYAEHEAYTRGVADAMRVLVGDVDPREASPTFAAIYDTYIDRN